MFVLGCIYVVLASGFSLCVSRLCKYQQNAFWVTFYGSMMVLMLVIILKSS